MAQIKTKTKMYELWQAGHLGNINQSWNTLEEFLESGFVGLIGIRYRIPSSPFARLNVPAKDVEKTVIELCSQGAQKHLFQFSEMLPDDRIALNAEVVRLTGGLSMFFSTVKSHMRDSLKRGGREVRGVSVLAILRQYVDPSSYQDIEYLLDTYPDAVVEFSTYEVCVGLIPNRNTVIWEVRNY